MKNRRSIRLKEYDYSQSGAYFVTICAHDRGCLFGEIVDGKMILNDAGKMIDEKWRELKTRFPNIELDEYVIMPNHFHGIVTLNPKIVGAGSSCPDKMMKSSCDGGLVGATLVVAQETTDDRAGTRPAPTRETTIGDIVGAFKSITTDQYINDVNTKNWQPFNGRLWQCNYYEHVIRNEDELNEIRQYIMDNPANWNTDEENPNVKPSKT